MKLTGVIAFILMVILIGCANSGKNEELYLSALSVNQETDPAYTGIRYESKFVPPDGKVLLIAGQDKRSITKFVPAWGITAGGFAMYFGIPTDAGIWSDHSSFEGDPNEINNFKWLAENYSNTTLQLALWFVGKAKGWDDYCGNITNGNYNKVLDSFCKFAKTYYVPIYLRIGYEFDGKHNMLNPREYKDAYRYIVDYIRNSGVSNVAFVWHSYVCLPYKNYDVMEWYPGDRYVDWFGMSIFGWQFNDKIHNFEISFIWNVREKFYSPYMDRFVDLAKEHKKPVMICESSPVGEGGIDKNSYKTWNNWFVPYLNYIHKKNIKAFSYINCDWSQDRQWAGWGWGNARIEEVPLILTQWTNEMVKGCYLKQSPGLYKILRYRD